MFGKSKKKNQDLPLACEFCEHATLISDDANVLCSESGIVGKEYHCKKYRYDPLKRVPMARPPMPTLSEEDLFV